jgi:hypothetical protein
VAFVHDVVLLVGWQLWHVLPSGWAFGATYVLMTKHPGTHAFPPSPPALHVSPAEQLGAVQIPSASHP